jgi:hypothetical protein
MQNMRSALFCISDLTVKLNLTTTTERSIISIVRQGVMSLLIWLQVPHSLSDLHCGEQETV